MRTPHTRVLGLAAFLALLIAGCGGEGSGDSRAVDPTVLSETIYRDVAAKYNRKAAIGDCRKTGDGKYECVPPSGGTLVVTIDQSGSYRATVADSGAFITGTYPEDVHFRGLDHAKLMREVVAQGKQQGVIEADAEQLEPACTLDAFQDRTYVCYIPQDSSGSGGSQGVTVGNDGRFKVPDETDNQLEFSGQLPRSMDPQRG